jgi:Ca2+-binding RTX toxin-like protein
MSVVIGTGGRDLLRGTAGTDWIVGGDGNDAIFSYGPPSGGGTFDVPRSQIADAADVAFGGRGHDVIYTGGGSDYADGGSGNDTIAGGVGADLLYGGAGRDVFLFEILEASPGSPSPDTLVGEGRRDVILDFRPGTDKIDLIGWESQAHPGAVFVGQDDVGFDLQLQIGYRHEGGNTIVELSRPFFEPRPGDEPGYFGPAGEIQIQGEVCLHASDFIFT